MFFMMDDYDTFFEGQLQKILFKKMLFFWTFYLSMNPKKKVSEGSHDTEA